MIKLEIFSALRYQNCFILVIIINFEYYLNSYINQNIFAGKLSNPFILQRTFLINQMQMKRINQENKLPFDYMVQQFKNQPTYRKILMVIGPLLFIYNCICWCMSISIQSTFFYYLEFIINIIVIAGIFYLIWDISRPDSQPFFLIYKRSYNAYRLSPAAQSEEITRSLTLYQKFMSNQNQTTMQELELRAQRQTDDFVQELNLMMEQVNEHEE